MTSDTLPPGGPETDTAPARIRHDPNASGDPYNPEPVGRTPRQPCAGEMTEIEASTWPAGSARRVWLSWRLAGQESAHVVEASEVGTVEDSTAWRASLPPFPEGSRVEYTLHAAREGVEGDGGDGGDEEETAGPFAFTVGGWHSLDTLKQVRRSGTSLVLTFSTPPGIPPTCVQLDITAED